jgi:hypothetical protein
LSFLRALRGEILTPENSIIKGVFPRRCLCDLGVSAVNKTLNTLTAETQRTQEWRREFNLRYDRSFTIHDLPFTIYQSWLNGLSNLDIPLPALPLGT